MLAALLHALDERIPASVVRGVYFKGSASKVWQAPCDYVPELSDLDLHIWLHEDATAEYEARFQDTSFGLAFAEAAEKAFLRRVPTPLHVPRPQVLLLNGAMRGAGRWSRSHAQVLRGEPSPGTEATAHEDREALLQVSAQAATLGLDLMDKLGPQLWTVLRAVGWRVSPLPARLLGAAGAGAWVWEQPRSALLPELRQRGFGEVADALEMYYAYAWAAFSLGWRDPAPMRAAVHAALGALALAAQGINRVL